MLIERRKFLTGLVGLIAAPAIVRIENLMLVKLIKPDDPLVRGIFWQSWPFGMPTPEVTAENSGFCQGSIMSDARLGKGATKLQPASYFVAQLEKHKQFYPDLVWRAAQPLERI